MPSFRFTGEVVEFFPRFGRELAPGDEIELDADPKHPRLVPETPRPSRRVTADQPAPAPAEPEATQEGS